jgi:hypothetical protein
LELRIALIVAVVVLCIYIAWLALRWRRVHRAPTAQVGDTSPHAHVFRDVDRFGAVPIAGHSLSAPALAPDDDAADDDSIVSLSSRPTPDARYVPPDPVRAPRPSEPDASGFGFDALLEVRQMRHLVDDLRNQQTRLAEELNRVRDELSALRAASRVAPAYAEAVSMVQRGLDASAIAERCGISVAEAELVRALSEQTAAEGGEGPRFADEQDDERGST